MDCTWSSKKLFSIKFFRKCKFAMDKSSLFFPEKGEYCFQRLNVFCLSIQISIQYAVYSWNMKILEKAYFQVPFKQIVFYTKLWLCIFRWKTKSRRKNMFIQVFSWLMRLLTDGYKTFRQKRIFITSVRGALREFCQIVNAYLVLFTSIFFVHLTKKLFLSSLIIWFSIIWHYDEHV